MTPTSHTTTATPVPNVLSSTCMLVHLKVSAWSGRRQEDRATDSAARDHNADKGSLTASKYLVPRESLAAVSKCAGALRLAHYKVTLPWMDEGSRVLPAAAYWRYCQETQTLINEFNTAADDFASRYPGLRANGHKLLGSLWDASQYPASVRDRFHAEATFLPFPDASDFRLAGMNGELSKLRDKLATIPNAVISTAHQDIAERVSTAVSRVVERMKSYSGTKEGAFRDSLIGNIRELVEVLPMLNIGDDPRISTMIADLDSLSRVEPAELRESQSLRDHTADSAQAILDRMKEFV